MIPQSFDYAAPASVQEALGLLSGGGKPLAGGMSLIPMMKLRLAAPGQLVDLGRIPGLDTIGEDAGSIHIGAMTTWYAIESSSLLRAKCPLLVETVQEIGDVQVRNMGTIGGSIAHADPSADMPAALMALEAQVKIVRQGGERVVPAAEFFVDTMTTALEPGELITEIIVPVESAGTGVSYKKFRQPASGFAIVGVAVRVRKEGGKIAFARIGVTGVSAKAYRATKAEEMLVASGDVAQAAATVAAEEDANSDLHASGDFRRHLAAVYAARAISEALAGTA